MKELVRNRNFVFYTVDINQNKKLIKLYEKYHFNYVFHFAAQAGVRYSLMNPRSYVENNISGFFNVLNLSIKFKVVRLFYASSSSAYGELNKFPLKENYSLKPKNIYGLSKKINEEMANVLLQKNKTQCIGLRFFTVYGEWGRPDMMILKYIEASIKKKIFYLYNYGNHTRDFTYIGDVIKIMDKLIRLKIKQNHEIFNICSNRPIKIIKIINSLNDLTNTPIIKKIAFQKADVLKTHGSNKKITKFLKFSKFTNINKGLFNTFRWYKNYFTN